MGHTRGALKAYLHPRHQHCTDEAQKAKTVLSAVSYIHLIKSNLCLHTLKTVNTHLKFSETLLHLAELVLTLNCFSFAGNYYKQINGVAMDTKMGPSYANLFVGHVEHPFFNQYDGPKPDFYGRYIDDCIGAISSSREELNRFITSVNSFHPALKYTWEISETSLAFLDIKVSINGNGLRTSVHYKPTDSQLFVAFIILPIPCQKFHSLFSIS